MELSKVPFSEQEKIFKERTGKDFSTLYQKYYPKLIYFTSRICNDVQKAEDISTDSFMIALEKIEMYQKEKSQFSTWLFTIAKNLSLQDKKLESAKAKKVFLDEREGLIERVDKILIDKKGRQLLREQY